MIEKIAKDFTDYAQEVQLPLEGFAVGDEKKVLFSHQFCAGQRRNIYSHTKSFMASAVGKAISQGLLSLEDRLADFFPESLPDKAPEALYEIRLKHLLTMSSGFGKPYLMGDDRRAGTGMPDYMAYMLSRPVKNEPGSTFVYSTADSILAGRMVEKATGKNLSVYLYEEILRPIGLEYPIWEMDPAGHPIGGGGMFLTLTDMMRLGQLYLAEGMWEGKRILEPSWVREATKLQIETPAGTQEAKKDYWLCGYGYQFWRCPYPESYRADGAFGQITVVLPKSGLTVSVQCPENGNFALVKDALHEKVFTRLSESF